MFHYVFLGLWPLSGRIVTVLCTHVFVLHVKAAVRFGFPRFLLVRRHLLVSAGECNMTQAKVNEWKQMFNIPRKQERGSELS